MLSGADPNDLTLFIVANCGFTGGLGILGMLNLIFFELCALERRQFPKITLAEVPIDIAYLIGIPPPRSGLVRRCRLAVYWVTVVLEAVGDVPEILFHFEDYRRRIARGAECLHWHFEGFGRSHPSADVPSADATPGWSPDWSKLARQRASSGPNALGDLKTSTAKA